MVVVPQPIQYADIVAYGHEHAVVDDVGSLEELIDLVQAMDDEYLKFHYSKVAEKASKPKKGRKT